MSSKLYLPSSMTPNRRAPDIWIPGVSRPAVKKIAVVFYHQKSSGRIMVGFPEQFEIPPSLKKIGFERVICRTAAEVDLWDKKMREQEKREEEMTDEQREAVEGPLRAYVRAELTTKMLNSRNPANRDFCRAALDALDRDERAKKMKRESFMHIVGYEAGK